MTITERSIEIVQEKPLMGREEIMESRRLSAKEPKEAAWSLRMQEARIARARRNQARGGSNGKD